MMYLMPLQVRLNPAAMAALRERSGYNQSEFARRLGISRQFIRALETGLKRPTPAMFERIREALLVPSAALLLDPEPPKDEAAEA
jgi:transcriptional regulator with XRE-family HTH domain